ncbi:GpE family phage tail protein [Burkholderia glumae]
MVARRNGRMPLPDLMAWRERARERYEQGDA